MTLSGNYATIQGMQSEDLGKTYLFQGSRPEALAAIAAGAGKKVLPAGDTLFKDGDKPAALYWIEFGAIQLRRVRRRRHEEVLVLGPGSLFGELGWLSGAARSAEASAVAASAVWEISYATLDKLKQESTGFGERLYRAMAVYLLGKLLPALDDPGDASVQAARFQ